MKKLIIALTTFSLIALPVSAHQVNRVHKGLNDDCITTEPGGKVCRVHGPDWATDYLPSSFLLEHCKDIGGLLRVESDGQTLCYARLDNQQQIIIMPDHPAFQ